MGQLIEALLNFSRLNRAPIRRQTVDLGDCVVKALEPLGKELKERQIDVEIGSLPQRQADPVLLQEVFANLLGNAVKFTRQSVAPRIEIGALSAADEQGKEVYFVRDNGAGFDMRYASKLFGVFQRLHREEEFEGTGAGLAIVQRIILRHGGRIWAESVKGQGATFYFTIGEEEFVAPAGEPPASVDLDHVST
jgi:light-regulated signal transduction histidine kinase (bacteriophytochrome)